jgi:hypothetical protein
METKSRFSGKRESAPPLKKDRSYKKMADHTSYTDRCKDKIGNGIISCNQHASVVPLPGQKDSTERITPGKILIFP